MAIATELYQDAGNGEIKKHIVSKIGRKYFYTTVSGQQNHYKFDKETLLHEDEDYSGRNVQLYETIKQIEDKNRFNELFQEIKRTFSHNPKMNFTLQQLELINKIINPS